MKFEILRATELASIEAYKLTGCGDKISIDQVALDQIRKNLNNIDFLGKVVLSEGTKDSAPNFNKNELVGKKRLELTTSTGSVAENINEPYCWSVLADVVDGTTEVANGGSEAISVVVVGKQDAFYVSDYHYMMKMAVGPKIAAAKLDIRDSLERTLILAAKFADKSLGNFVVCLLNRPRHNDLINTLRRIGVRIKLINNCDITAAIATCFPESNIDMLLGIGGNPEGLISAAGLKCLGGDFQCILCDNQFNLLSNQYYNNEILISGNLIFCMTSVLNGMLLRGVRYVPGGYITHSLMTDSAARSLQRIETFHWVA